MRDKGYVTNKMDNFVLGKDMGNSFLCFFGRREYIVRNCLMVGRRLKQAFFDGK